MLKTNQHTNNLASLSFEQPFLDLVPFPESLDRTVSVQIFKRCSPNSPVKTNSPLVVGAGWLQICGETEIVEREFEGQITGDFSLLVGLGSVPCAGAGGSSDAGGGEVPGAASGATGIFPTWAAFESGPGRVFQTTVIFRVTPWFLPCTTDLLVTSTYLPVFNIQVWVFVFFAFRNNMLLDTFPGGKWTPTYTQSYTANLYLVEFIILSMLLWTLCMGCSSNPKIVKNFSFPI